MEKLICIVCPRGCHLSVDVNNGYKTTGNACERGAEYAKNELSAPMRTLTTTVVITGAECRRCPVKTNKNIPKQLMMQVMHELDAVRLTAPVKIGDVVLKNVLGTNADVVVTRRMGNQ